MALGAYVPPWVQAGDPAGAFARGEELGLRRRQLRQEDQRTKAADALRRQNQEMLNNYRKQQADDRTQRIKDAEEAARSKSDMLKAAHADTVAFQGAVKKPEDIPGALLKYPQADPHVIDVVTKNIQTESDRAEARKTKTDEDTAKQKRLDLEASDTAGYVDAITPDKTGKVPMSPGNALKQFSHANPSIVGAALNRQSRQDTAKPEALPKVDFADPNQDFTRPAAALTRFTGVPANNPLINQVLTTNAPPGTGTNYVSPGAMLQRQPPPATAPIAQPRPLGQKVTTAKGSFTWGGPDKGWLPVQAEQPSAPAAAPQLPEGVP